MGVITKKMMYFAINPSVRQKPQVSLYAAILTHSRHVKITACETSMKLLCDFLKCVQMCGVNSPIEGNGKI